jgi:hypothetical protein
MTAEKCPHCTTGRLIRDLAGEDACLNCGYRRYPQPTESVPRAGPKLVQTAGAKKEGQRAWRRQYQREYRKGQRRRGA